MFNQEWKEIPGFNGRYLVSNCGQIKSAKTGTILKQQINKYGYLRVMVLKDRKAKEIKVHRAVAMAFLGDTTKRTVNHKNGVKTDNNVNNLEWATHSENHFHAYRTLGRKPPPNPKPPKSVIATNGDEILIFRSLNTAELYGFHKSNIRDCLKGKQKKYKGYTWKYFIDEGVIEV